MKLDRNIEGNEGRGKYALLLLRRLGLYRGRGTFDGLNPKIAAALKTLEDAGVVDWGYSDSESEFFLIRLKDKYAKPALHAYADAAREHDPQWAAEVDLLASRAGTASPFCKQPD